MAHVIRSSELKNGPHLFYGRLLNHPESVLIHRTALPFPHLLPLASHRSRTQAPIDLVLRRCVPWLQDPEASSTEPGLQAALGPTILRANPWRTEARRPRGGDVGGGGSRLEVGASAVSLSSPPWRGGRPVPPLPLPPRQQVARGRPVAGRDPPPCAAAGSACGKRKCAALGPAADDGRATYHCSSWCGGGLAPTSSPLWCAGGPASSTSLHGLARRRWRACCAYCPRRPPRGAGRGGASAMRSRWGRRPAGGWQRATPPPAPMAVRCRMDDRDVA